jgi:hypothetical protein
MLTLDDVGRHWQLRPAAVRQRIASGELRAVRIAGRYRTNWPSVWACERGRCPEPSEAERYKIPLWTKGDLAALMGVSTRTVERWVAEGLPTRSIGENRRFHPSEAADWLRERFGMNVEDLIAAVSAEGTHARRR